MIWQDIGIMVIQWSALVALLPTLWSKDKPPLSTSIFTGMLMLALGGIFITLHFWSSTVSAFSVGAVWLFIGFQKYQTIRRDMKYDVRIRNGEELKASETTS